MMAHHLGRMSLCVPVCYLAESRWPGHGVEVDNASHSKSSYSKNSMKGFAVVDCSLLVFAASICKLGRQVVRWVTGMPMVCYWWWHVIHSVPIYWLVCENFVVKIFVEIWDLLKGKWWELCGWCWVIDRHNETLFYTVFCCFNDIR